jgi:HEAT repeat protein
MLIFLISCALPPHQKAVDILLKGIADESVIIQVSAAKGLVLIGDDRGIQVFHQTLESEDQDAVVASLSALSDVQEQTVLPIVLTLAESRDALIRTEAYQYIARIDSEICRKILIEGITDSVARIRAISYRGLEKFKEKEAMYMGLRDVNPLVRIAAARALENLGERGMEDFIMEQVQTINSEVFRVGVIAVAEIGDTSLIPILRRCLEDMPWEFKIAAAEALLILNDNSGVSILKEGLKSHDPFIRIATLDIFERHDIPDALSVLKDAVHDEYVNVSVGAIDVLATYHAQECKKIFEEMMDAPNPLVKIAAAAAYVRSE